MKTVEDWRTLLRAELRRALVARQTHAATVLREALAAIDNAEAPPLSMAPAAQGSASFAGSVDGLGAGEVPRLELDPHAVAAIIEREISERTSAAAQYAALGQHDEAAILSQQSELLAALANQ